MTKESLLKYNPGYTFEEGIADFLN